ncbi:MAG TPA: nitronate monooxygenase [Gammaproteobacteria bacterium]|nr:nitronate monooxygenase [Gammaproteobacteria bacterium]
MWPHTKIIQAPMAGGATTPELVAAVSNAGGLGSFAAGYLSPDEIRSSIRKIRALTSKPFAVNLFIPEEHHATDHQIEQARKIVQASCAELNTTINTIKPPYSPAFDDQMNVLLEEKISVFSFTFGIPSREWIEKFKENNILLVGTATTLSEAKLLQKNNIDAIVLQGSEAGGHRGSFLDKPENSLVKLKSLLSTVIPEIKIPVIAAGGIMNAQEIITLLKLGASAVQMGTAFLTCTESGIHANYKKALLHAKNNSTVLTRAFSGKLARGLKNKFIVNMQPHEKEILDYPIQNALTKQMRQEASKQNNTDFMSMWAGEAAYLCKAVSAAELMQALSENIQKTL